MKNLSLLLVLITLTTFAYFINNESKEIIRDLSSLKSIQATRYQLVKKDVWEYENKTLKKEFIKNYFEILSSLELVGSNDYKGKAFGELKLKYKDKEDVYTLGQKVFSNNGIFMKVNAKWFIVKLNFSKDIVYKDDNDLAAKQYDIIYNIFNFSSDLILKNTVNKP